MKTIHPFKYSNPIQAPFSKSYLQRAIAITGLLKGETEIIGFTPSNDALVALKIIEQMGSSYQLEGEKLIIKTPSVSVRKTINISCGEAGLSTRMFSPILATIYSETTISGEGSILTRPMDMVIDALEQLGIYVESNDGFLPLKTLGEVKSTDLIIDGSESSQLLTGLLIALSNLDRPSKIEVKNLKSIPYVQMTLDILSHFGISIVHDDFKTFRIKESQFNQPWKNRTYEVEGDWSGASFHAVGGAISGEVILKGLHPNSAQADKEILVAIERAGAKIEWKNDLLCISKNELKAFTFDATNCPDLFPPIAALAACCEGESTIIGTNRLAHKESDRANTIQVEMEKLGIKIELGDNEMKITGGRIKPSVISSHNDHRIAMMGAVLSSVSGSSIGIKNPNAINKSYPNFYEDLETQARASFQKN